MKTSRFLAVTFALAAMATGLFAMTSPSQATYYCHWTPRGQVCTWSP